MEIQDLNTQERNEIRELQKTKEVTNFTKQFFDIFNFVLNFDLGFFSAQRLAEIKNSDMEADPSFKQIQEYLSKLLYFDMIIDISCLSQYKDLLIKRYIETNGNMK